jgi:hypothetical protein
VVGIPKEHRTSLWEGSQRNFLKEPKQEIHDNAVMDEEQLDVAAAFVDELHSILESCRTFGRQIIPSNFPLFSVPKEGQEGQWRVIANLLWGGQNGYIGAGPMVLPLSSHILDQIYEKGYSAVVDSSK